MFQNLKKYDPHLIMQELQKFDYTINVTPNGLKKYMSFRLDNKFVSIVASSS